MSPSMRREWIEICDVQRLLQEIRSPSMRREWIEMFFLVPLFSAACRLPPCGGSGLKLQAAAVPQVPERLPPCGGSGLKCAGLRQFFRNLSPSPSMRREWIEMLSRCTSTCVSKSPSMRREWIEMKSNDTSMTALLASPSMRREWIEMTMNPHQIPLHICLPPCGGSGLKSQ